MHHIAELMVAIELLIGAIKALVILVLVLNLTGVLLWFERKGAALIQDRIGANRAAIFGVGKKLGMPNFGFINTLIADPVKLFTKEDFIPDGADRFVHGLAPFLALFPVIITFAVVPIGDVLTIGSRSITLQAAELNVAALYILAVLGVGVYGVALGGWASNNRWALLGGIRASAQMISYEIAMGLAIIAVVVVYGSLDLQEMCRAQGGVWFGWLPRWGILLQPVSFLLLLTSGMAESKRVPFDLPEGESELVAGYFTEYSGGKQAVFMMTDFAEVVLVATLITLFFFGGWQVPWLYADGFHFPGPHGASLHLPNLLVAILQIIAFWAKVVFFCCFQILIRWTLPRLRYDQLMQFGWKGLVPLALLNLLATAFVVVAMGAK
ncbi:MAG TPA: complex I subunit 1 family protein [Candidatus Binataceae bacterium]|nr:complex I subunit 1 family protein [Candidatus Binataceae bacterium]